MNKCAIAYVPHTRGSIYAHPNGPVEGPAIEIVAITIDGREQDMGMVPKYVLEAAEAWAEAVERAKEDEKDG